MNYFKILRFLQKGDKNLFDVSVEEQKQFIGSLGIPHDDIDRSYKQYRCQNLYVPKWKSLMINIVFLFAPIFLLLFYLVKGFFVRKVSQKDAIASLKVEYNYYAPELLEEYKVDDSVWGKCGSLKVGDLGFINKVLSKWFASPYFVSKSIFLLAEYSDMITKYSPSALLAHCEFSFTSSLLTAYCESKGVEHINTMHGEKLFYIRDSFFRFSRCYVWDEHYVDLFTLMKAEESQFRICVPECLVFDCKRFENIKYYADYKYYLAVFSEEELKQIISTLQQKVPTGKTFKLRPHPRYSDVNMLMRFVSEDNIERPEDVTIQESISNCEFVIGSYTTVLNQAFFSGKTVVLDDVAYEEQQKKLSEMQYFLASQNTLHLSKI